MFHIYRKDVIDSTNSWAKRERITNAVFIANRQTKGRGRLNRKWVSDCEKNLYFSLKFEVSDIKEAMDYNFVMSLSIAETLKEMYELEVTLKWPNDLMIENKKFSGILSEYLEDKNGRNVIIGVGINCRFNTKESELDHIATSLHYYLSDLDKEKFFNAIIKNFEKLSYEYQSKGFECVLNKWDKYAKIKDRVIKTTLNGNKKIFKVLKLNNDGSLEVIDKDGNIKTVFVGDVEYVKESNN